MEARYDPTPLPPARPPTIEARTQRPRLRASGRGRVFWLVGLLALVSCCTALLLLVDAYRDLETALAESRDEAAVLRKRLFRTEDELRSLKDAQQRAPALVPSPVIPPTKAPPP